VPAEAGKAYPYGTRIATGAGASLTLALSKDNECVVGENTSLTAAEDADDPRQKILRVRSGKVSTSLEENYEQNNLLRVVSRCSTVVCKTGGQSSVDVSMEEDLKVVVVSCDLGQIAARGPGFEIPVIEKNDWVSISCSHDRGFVRIKNIKGDFGVTVKDSQASPRLVATEEGTVIKILRKTADTAGRDIVTVLEVAPDGTVKQADTYSEPIDREKEILPEDEPVPELTRAAREPRVPTEKDEWPAIPPTATTTTTTTTTTVPPKDAARARKGIKPVPPVVPVQPSPRPTTTRRTIMDILDQLPTTSTTTVHTTTESTSSSTTTTTTTTTTSTTICRPSIDVSPSQLDFGRVKIGECKTVFFTVWNNGGGWIDVSTSVSGPHFGVGGVPRLYEGDSAGVAVYFCPVEVGEFTETVQFLGSGECGPASDSSSVTGEGYGDVTPTGKR
jgi:hypothetical protein